jgi:hypothetical protein
MDAAKIHKVIESYRVYFVTKGTKPVDFPHDRLVSGFDASLEHCYSMLSKIDQFVVEGRLEKAFRWLGFIQGCFWSIGLCSLDELKEHNRPDTEGN